MCIRDRDAIGKIGDVWNSGCALEPGKAIDRKDSPSAGPYRVESYTAEGGLELIANDKWWGEQPATGHIVVWPRGTEATKACLLYTSPSPRDRTRHRMPSSA